MMAQYLAIKEKWLNERAGKNAIKGGFFGQAALQHGWREVESQRLRLRETGVQQFQRIAGAATGIEQPLRLQRRWQAAEQVLADSPLDLGGAVVAAGRTLESSADAGLGRLFRHR